MKKISLLIFFVFFVVGAWSQTNGYALTNGNNIIAGTATVTASTGTMAITSQIKSFTYGSGQTYSVTATGTDEVAYSTLIPAGTISANAVFEIRALLTTIASANTKNFKVWLSTASETPGQAPSGSATQIMLYNGNGGTSTSVGIYRMFAVRSLTTVMAGRGATTSLSNDVGNFANVNTLITVPTFASNVYLVFSFEHTTGGEVVSVEFAYGLFRNL